MTIEQELQAAVATVIPCDHLAMDGEREKGAVYRLAGIDPIYESGEPIWETERYEISVAQQEHDPGVISSVVQALDAAGFSVRVSGAQELAELTGIEYSIDRLTAHKGRQIETEET